MRDDDLRDLLRTFLRWSRDAHDDQASNAYQECADLLADVLEAPAPGVAALQDMREASALVDSANGTSDYQTRLVVLALIARHYLREIE